MPRRRPAARRSPHALLRWESLGHSVTGLEPLEARVALAADLAIAFVGPQAAHAWYQPGTTETFKVEVTNLGPDTATGAAVTTTLGSQISQQTWTAAFSTGASGTTSGSGPLATTVTLPSGGKATFTITATVAESATGTMTPSARVTLAGDPTATNDSATETLKFAPKFLVVTDAMGRGATSQVRIVDPKTGAVIGGFNAVGGSYGGGIQAAVGDFDGTNRPMVAVVPGRGVPALLKVFALSDAGTWQERPEFRTTPFAGSTRGLTVAAGDFNADGRDDFALGDAGGDEVKVFLARKPTPQNADPVENAPFRTLTRPGVGGGIAAADFGTFSNGRATDAAKQDGRAELALATGAGVAPRVRVVDLSGAKPVVIDTIRPDVGRDRAGLTVSATRIDTGTIPEILVTGGGSRGRTEVYDGTVATAANRRLAVFNAFGDLGREAAPGGVAAIDTNGDGRAETLLSSQGYLGAAGVKSLGTTGLATGAVGPFSRFGAFRRQVEVAAPPARTNPDIVTSSTGLQSITLASGPTTGTAATAGRKLKVNYTGTLLDGTKFDSSRDPGKSPFEFTLGQGQVIKGWDEGLLGRRAGDRLQLIIPSGLGYGASGQGSIPPNATLVFDIEVVSVT